MALSGNIWQACFTPEPKCNILQYFAGFRPIEQCNIGKTAKCCIAIFCRILQDFAGFCSILQLLQYFATFWSATFVVEGVFFPYVAVLCGACVLLPFQELPELKVSLKSLLPQRKARERHAWNAKLNKLLDNHRLKEALVCSRCVV